MHSEMPQTRIILVVLALAALAAGAFLAMNLGTSESAWRRANPSGAEGREVRIPAKAPARDAAGVVGWSWPEGTPGWRPGERIDGYPVAGLDGAEITRAKNGAALVGANGSDVRVIGSIRGSESGLLAILAAPAEADRALTCLAAMLHRNAEVDWWCPGAEARLLDLSDASVLVAAKSFDWPGSPEGEHPLYFVGVARGDVRRVVLESPGNDPETVYVRGRTWGQFSAARSIAGEATLRVYGPTGLIETLELHVEPGEGRVFS